MAMSNEKSANQSYPGLQQILIQPTQQKHICQPHDDTDWQLDTNSDMQNSKSQSEI